MRRLPRWQAAAVGPAATASGLAVFMACGIGVALLAASVLDASSYTVFAAFSALLGLLVLGPASALEQETTLRAERTGGTAPRPMLLRAGGVWGVLVAVVLLAPRGWGERLLADELGLVRLLVLVGAPVVFVVAIGRGLAVRRAAYRFAGALHLTAGAALLLLPPVLRAAGTSWLDAFLVGALTAWVPALLLLVRLPPAISPTDAPAASAGSGTTSVQLVNLLVLANLMAVPAVLRWHVTSLGAAEAADLQLFVSISRLSTTLVLGCLPLLLHRLATGTARDTGGATARLVAAATVFGLLAAGAAAAVAPQLVTLISGRTTAVELHAFALAAAPVLLLCPALVLLAAALVEGRRTAALLAWGGGLLGLGAVTVVEPRSTAQLLLGVLAAAAVPLVVLAADRALRTIGRGPVQERTGR